MLYVLGVDGGPSVIIAAFKLILLLNFIVKQVDKVDGAAAPQSVYFCLPFNVIGRLVHDNVVFENL